MNIFSVFFRFSQKIFARLFGKRPKFFYQERTGFREAFAEKELVFLQNPEKASEEFLQDILWNLVLTFLRFCGIIQVS
ncbi:MAG: hypothetical protein II405_06635 [Oscillospiraceae bacterium]|nr:hypothetical protein [Oscillospiraceae bacterium]MBQ5467741.1 hypothetical protein [Oscillospiraceae bacterium]